MGHLEWKDKSKENFGFILHSSFLKNPGLLKLKQAHLPVFLLHTLFSLQLIKMPIQQPHGFFFRKKPFFHIVIVFV